MLIMVMMMILSLMFFVLFFSFQGEGGYLLCYVLEMVFYLYWYGLHGTGIHICPGMIWHTGSSLWVYFWISGQQTHKDPNSLPFITVGEGRAGVGGDSSWKRRSTMFYEVQFLVFFLFWGWFMYSIQRVQVLTDYFETNSMYQYNLGIHNCVLFKTV